MSDVLYFGCWNGPGHFLWLPSGRHAPTERDNPWQGNLDCVLCPSNPMFRGHATPAWAQAEGSAALHHLDGWTAIAFWDRSCDKRYGSNSAFLLGGTFALDETIRLAREAFPSIWARFTFEIKVREPWRPATVGA